MLVKNLEPMTMDTFNKLEQQDHLTYELIDGIVLMSPRPNIDHQRIQSVLLYKIAAFLDGNQCHVISETEIELEEQVVVPDLFVYCDDISKYEQRYKGVPLIVIEILSKSTAFTDLNRKNHLYQRLGVREYWVVSPTAKVVTVNDYQMKTTEEFDAGHIITSEALAGLEIAVKDLFI